MPTAKESDDAGAVVEWDTHGRWEHAQLGCGDIFYDMKGTGFTIVLHVVSWDEGSPGVITLSEAGPGNDVTVHNFVVDSEDYISAVNRAMRKAATDWLAPYGGWLVE